MFEVVLSRDAAKVLERVTPTMKRRIVVALEKLKHDPQTGKRLHGELEGLFSLRVGGMRAVYEVDGDQKMVIVHGIGPRGDIYKN